MLTTTVLPLILFLKVKQKCKRWLLKCHSKKLNVVLVSNKKRNEKTISKISKKNKISKKFDKNNKLVGPSTGKGASISSNIGPSNVASIDKPAVDRPVAKIDLSNEYLTELD